MAPYILQLAALLILPLVFIVSLWRANEADRLRWLLKVIYSGVFIAYMLAMGRWDSSSVYLRYALVFLYVAAAFKSYFATKGLPFIAPIDVPRKSSPYAAPVLLLVFFSAFLGWAVRGYFYPGAAVELKLPLRDGWFYVGQGGNSLGVNHHNSIEAQQYAVDIVALNAFGSRAHGLYPKELTKFAIYGQPVVSPCNGRIEQVVEDLPDQIPPNSDRRNVAGNHVVISCQGVEVLLAHLQQGSVEVTKGDKVSEGAPIGSVGNSGNTSEPHLHVHAIRAGSGDILRGQGVPAIFDGVFPIRNTTFR